MSPVLPGGFGCEMNSSNGPEKTEIEIADDRALDWLVHLTSGAATKADLKAMEQWRHSSPVNEAAMARASKLWRSVSHSAGNLTQRGQFQGEVRRPSLQRRALFGGVAAAAGVYVIMRPPFGLWPSFQELASDYRTGPGEQRKIMLAGASVELNTETSLNAWAAPGGNNNIKLLSGEAVISTAANVTQQLTVIAANGQTNARAATFDVRYIDALVCVTCIAGSVDVLQAGRAVTLQEKQQVTYSNGGIGKPMSIDPAQVTAWQQGVLIFHGTPLSEVVAEVNRYLPGRIVLLNEGLGRKLVTARFQLDRLGDVLTQMQDVFGAHITRLPGGVVLVGT